VLFRSRLTSRSFVFICAGNFLYFGSFYLLLPILPQYVVHLGGSASQIGLVMGIFTFSSILIRPYLARLADTRGRRFVLLAATASFALLFLPYMKVQTMIPLYCLRILHGVVHGAFLAAAFAYVADLAPHDRRGEVMGIFGVANVLSMALSPALGIWLFNASGGSFFFPFIASVILASLAFLAITMIDEMKPGLSKTEKRSFTAIVRQRAIWVSSLSLFSGATVYGAMVTFLPVYAPQRGLRNFGIFFTVYAASTILSRVITGRLSDRVGRSRVVIPFMGLLAIAVFLLPFLHSIPMLVLIGACFGMSFGTYMPTLNALIVDETPPRDRGPAIAFFTAFMDVGITTGAILLGVAAEFWGYAVMFTIGGFVVVGGLLLFSLCWGWRGGS
jgi:MFS family permease